LTEQLQHYPRKGEKVTHEGLLFRIQKVSHKRIRHILITKIPEGKLPKKK
jgi:CBS domain containing-hemolysin-like protein